MDNKDIFVVACDDGSGNISFAFTNENEQITTGIRPSIVQKGDAYSADGLTSSHAWIDDKGEVYTAVSDSISPENTCDPQYQTSAANRALVLDTLSHTAKLAGKKVMLGVTLPAGHFFRNNKPDQNLIERKRQNLLSHMENANGDTDAPEIVAVHVYPEAIPAYVHTTTSEQGTILTKFADVSRAIVVDVGQFTCDLALIGIQEQDGRRNMQITNLHTSEHGVHQLHNSLRAKLAAKNLARLQHPENLTRNAIETLIERGFIGSPMKKEAQIDLTPEITAAKRELAEQIRSDLRTLHRDLADVDVVILVGGGAHLLREFACSEDPAIGWHDVVIVPEKPEMAVVLGVHRMMMQSKARLLQAV
ncbi:ParM/StbA family protein [Edwardsiella tarda]|uniref:ParM/StbA family protein n=1 Tax=Edwardsiella tarda TaxID=636 RepID=UPI0002F03B5E|nr:ParM/StbA family protein [Edwardsiella tarda]